MDSSIEYVSLTTSIRTPEKGNLYSANLIFLYLAIADRKIDLTHNLLDSNIGVEG